MKLKYYGVAGQNGLGLFDDYNKAIEKKQYLKGFKIKSFKSMNEACSYAVEEYNQMQEFENMLFPYAGNGFDKINWIYYRHEILEGKYNEKK